jgi:CSLREA domain-containing protein
MADRTRGALCVPAVALAVLLGNSPIFAWAATFTTNSTADTADVSAGDGICETAPGNGVCTLRAALQEANALAGADTINVAAGTYVLTAGELQIGSDMTIAGAGAATTIIDGNANGSVFRGGSTAVGISGLTIQNGSVDASTLGGGISLFAGSNASLTDVVVQNNSAGEGGGIYSSNVNLTLTRVAVLNNSTKTSAMSSQFKLGGGIYHSGAILTIVDSTIRGNSAVSAGGLFNMGTATVVGSTISGNTATNDDPLLNSGEGGGGIVNGSGSAGTLTITNSTISGNRAHGHFGGIYNANGSITLNSTTISANVADFNADGHGNGGGIRAKSNSVGNPVTIYLRNTIVAGNIANAGTAKDCSNTIAGRVVSYGYNLLGNNSQCAFSSSTGDQIGTAANPIDAMLAAIADNGGQTQTHALLAGSPAIDGGNAAGCDDGAAALATDQRGVSRSINGGSGGARCDIGAHEFNSVIAKAGPDQQVNTGVLVQLDGGNSTSPAGLASYLWTQTGGGAVTLSGAMTATPSFTAPAAAATLTFQLTVTDNSAATHNDTVVVTVVPSNGNADTGGGGGGCTMAPHGKADPLLPAMLVLGAIVMWQRRRAK